MEEYSEPIQISMVELRAKIVNGFQPLAFSSKSSS